MPREKTSTSQATDPMLVGLIEELLRTLTSASAKSRSRHIGHAVRGRYFAEHQLGSSAASEAIAEKILVTLGKPISFEGAWEVTPFLTDRLQEVGDELGPEDTHVALAKCLRDPLRPWPFRIRLFDYAPYAIDWEPGGVHALKLKGVRVPPDRSLLKAAKRAKEQFKRAGDREGARLVRASKKPHLALALQGSVEAATLEGAMRRVERVLDTFLGATRALGLAEYLETRTPFSSSVVELGGHAVALASAYSDRIASSALKMPEDLTELERAREESGDLNSALGRHFRVLERTLAGTDERSAFVRNACRIAINAEASLDFGVLVSLAFSAMEGLLVGTTGTENVMAKLTEAVAFSLGRGHSEREILRKEVKDLYKIRSTFVHQAQSTEVPTARRRTLDLLFRVLRREMEMLEAVPDGELENAT